MKRFIEGVERGQSTLFPECLEDWVGEDNPVRVVDVFVDDDHTELPTWKCQMKGIKMIKNVLLGASMALVAGITTPALAQDSSFEIGTLTCKVVDVTNLVIYTNEKFACDFAGSDGLVENYGGEIKSIGVNLSIKKDFTIVWAVIAPTNEKYQALSLKGSYVGASADAALGLGAGAKVLVGGGSNSFTLQPISVAGVKGAGAAVGIQRFKME